MTHNLIYLCFTQGCSQKPKEIKRKLRASRTNEVVSKKMKGDGLEQEKPNDTSVAEGVGSISIDSLSEEF